MKTAYVIRLKLPMVKIVDQVADLEKMRAYLYVFMNLTLPSIIHQTNQDFICFIQHQVEVTEVIHECLNTLGELPPHIRFTTNMRQEVSDYLLDLHQKGFDQIYLIKLGYNLLCAHDLIDFLHSFTLPPSTRVLTFSNLFAYNLNRQAVSSISDEKCNAYIYICSMREYVQHLRLYDYYYTALLDQKYLLFPKQPVTHPSLLYLAYNGPATSEPPILHFATQEDELSPFLSPKQSGGAL